MRLQLEVVGVLSLGVGGAAWCDAIWPLAVCVGCVCIAMLVSWFAGERVTTRLGRATVDDALEDLCEDLRHEIWRDQPANGPQVVNHHIDVVNDVLDQHRELS